jgi:hypothetical protein
MLYRYEGSVNKISVDEKGATMVAAFGLPPMAHEDDAVRGSLAALNIVTALRELGVRVTIGVTTGRVFCGLVGTESRREYTMIGDAVNLSARLMQLAGKLPQLSTPILCDSATEAASRHRITYEAHPAVTLKGKAVPLCRMSHAAHTRPWPYNPSTPKRMPSADSPKKPPSCFTSSNCNTGKVASASCKGKGALANPILSNTAKPKPPNSVSPPSWRLPMPSSASPPTMRGAPSLARFSI